MIKKLKNNKIFFVILVLIATSLLAVIIYQGVGKVRAEERSWIQTDWRGGVNSSVITEDVTTFSQQENLDFSKAGSISMAETSNWSLLEWSYRRKITFNNTLENIGVSPENLTNFPLLVKLENGINIDYSKTKIDGSDIRFVDSDGTNLSYEIEDWNPSGLSFVWVKIPQVDIGDQDYINMYFGNPSATDGQSPASVWDNDFVGVWHLNQSVSDQGIMKDSKGLFNGTWQNSTGVGSTGQTGLIGKSAFFNSNNKVATTINTQLTNFSVEIWFKDDKVVSPYERIADKSYTGCFWVGRNNGLQNSWGGGVMEARDPYGIFVTLPDGEWNQIVSVRSGTNHYMYGNGSSQIKANTVSTNACNSSLFGLGAYGDTQTQQRFGGHIDEVRLSSIARSRPWVAASYKSGKGAFNVYEEEVSHFAPNGYVVSNVFDTGYLSDWGSLSFTSSGPNSFSVKVRSDINVGMNSAPDWSSCEALETGIDLSSTNCVDDEERYIQYQISFIPLGGVSPTFEEISISFTSSDQTRPTSNAKTVYMGNSVENDNWVNFSPNIIWSEGSDNVGGGGIEGYCISLNEVGVSQNSETLDPAISSGKLTGLDDGIASTACPFIVTGENIDLSKVEGLTLFSNKKYYFSIKAVDFAGNIWAGSSELYQDLVWFRFDNTLPKNVMYISTPSVDFGSIDDMFFNWPITGTSRASDQESELLGWQYAINSTEQSAWKGTSFNSKLGIHYIPSSEDISILHLSISENGSDVIVGNNTIYFRSIDNAGNVSTYVTGGINYGGAAPEFPPESLVNISPTTNTSNEFSLSWPEAIVLDGEEVASYYYMINTQPPSNLETLKNNSNIYIPTNELGVPLGALIGAVKGTNNVYVVAVDDKDNYSPTKAIHGTFFLNSTLPDAPTSLSAADLSVKSSKLWRVALTWGEPAYKGNGNLSYIVNRSEDGITWTEVTRTSGLSYTDITPSSKLYYYKVASIDTSNESKLNPSQSFPVTILPKGRFDNPAELVSGPVISGITTRNAQINWATDRVSDSKVQIGVNSNEYFENEMYKSEMVTDHELALTNLLPGTQYFYRIKWTDGDGNTGVSKESIFQTNLAPRVEDVEISSVGLNYSVLDLSVKGAVKANVLYGKTKSYGGSKEINTSTVSSKYSIMLTELEDGTEYHYTIVLTDEEGFLYENFGDLVFTTPPRPQVSNVQVQEKKGVPSPTVEIFWQSNIAVNSIVRYTNEGKTLDKIDMELVKGDHMMEISELKANSDYKLIVEGVDAMGNRAMSETYSFTTATDTRPPEISSIKSEGDIQSSEIQSDRSRSGQLIVSWDTDEPSTSQVMYGEGTGGGGYPFSTQTDGEYRYKHVMIVSNLAPSKVYHFKVLSKDSSGNVGESGSVTAITPKSVDTVVQSVLSSLSRIFGFL